MTKRFFTSLLLGFGGTLAVLVAISMPPGGWSVAVGVALGLLAALPLFLVVMALVKRQPPVSSYRGSSPMPSGPIIQQQLPQAQSMPLPPHLNPYNYGVYPEQDLDYADDFVDPYESRYVGENMADPRLLAGSKRRIPIEYVPIQRPRQQPAQNYYERLLSKRLIPLMPIQF